MGRIIAYTGEGRGKTPAAMGDALYNASKGRQVVVVQFLKGKANSEQGILSLLEPGLKIFRFEKADLNYNDLNNSEKKDEVINIRNGINFAKKVISTDGCDLLVLDEILGLVDNGILPEDELLEMLEACPDSMDITMTGINISERISAKVDLISGITQLK